MVSNLVLHLALRESVEIFLLLGLQRERSVHTLFVCGKDFLILTVFLRAVALELGICLWASNGKLENIGLVSSLDVHWLSDVTKGIIGKSALFVDKSEYWKTPDRVA
ncbi:unnamed protein product [Schistosoma mattheei]|uniref:Uncharacterized protein n=1 Tax=Schistosoma mattheei TaxID=31246 RepID=A0A183NM27_9TREM|nr:unnamed protein product [Schistosoma mattheei]